MSGEGPISVACVSTLAQARALSAVAQERDRQTALIEAGTIPYACEDPATPNGYKLAVLAEEFGEVAKALNEGTYRDLREELVQVAAVAVAWVEGIDERERRAAA